MRHKTQHRHKILGDTQYKRYKKPEKFSTFPDYDAVLWTMFVLENTQFENFLFMNINLNLNFKNATCKGGGGLLNFSLCHVHNFDLPPPPKKKYQNVSLF